MTNTYGTCGFLIGYQYHGLNIYSLISSIPVVVFIFYLLYKFPIAIKILREYSNTKYITSFYFLLWTASLVTLLRIIVQGIFLRTDNHNITYFALWMLSRFAVQLLEFLVLEFLLHLPSSGTNIFYTGNQLRGKTGRIVAVLAAISYRIKSLL